MRIVATIEARMGSKRLPGKVLLKAKNKTMLEILVERLMSVKIIDEIVVATTTNNKDDEIVNVCDKINLKYFRGSEEDVFGRVIGAAKFAKADLVVQITGDCPIIDPNIVEQIINIYKYNSVDCVGNGAIRSYPDGMDAQVFSLSTLEKSYSMTDNKLDKEHVTRHILRNPEIFSKINLIAPPEIFFPELGLTLDEKDDYLLLKNIIENLYDKNKYFSCLEVIHYLNSNQSLYSLNNHVQRRWNP
ncbi:cytidylyltransferase domain-containing protein [Prochlorococcus sp. MIT 0604]|uniref:cytidylyltransferase domain-containing protein n=1 Tax=Prochlorococcus sp. MIT 0604 TaxID=1501268 RepID=UPI0004F6C072|nr:glycosyltransferase family protein [Prochlorococcus sp. MIT 0604]AIQ95505.1 Acylneuraminate cytidylyltransferase [Prochlorococcus sp. MIT 0604]